MYGVSFVALEICGLALFLVHALFLDWYFVADGFFMRDRLTSLPYFAFQILFFTMVSTGMR